MYILMCLLIALPLKVDLEKVGCYKQGSVDSIYKIDKYFLLCSRSESKLILINENGKIENVYDKKGQGPGELNKPMVMNITDDKIYIFNNNSSIVEIDHGLNNGRPSELPKFKYSSSLMKSVFGKDAKITNSYFKYPVGNDKLVYRHEMKQGKWLETGSFFTQEKPNPRKNEYHRKSKIVFDGTIAFYVPKGNDDPYYEIHVYDFSSNDDNLPVSVLAQEVDAKERNPLGNYLYFDCAASFKDGYMIEISYLDNKEWTYIHDYFDKAGKFKKRVPVGSDVKLIPVQNSDEIFIFRDLEEGPVLELFHPLM